MVVMVVLVVLVMVVLVMVVLVMVVLVLVLVEMKKRTRRGAIMARRLWASCARPRSRTLQALARYRGLDCRVARQHRNPAPGVAPQDLRALQGSPGVQRGTRVGHRQRVVVVVVEEAGEALFLSAVTMTSSEAPAISRPRRACATARWLTTKLVREQHLWSGAKSARFLRELGLSMTLPMDGRGQRRGD